MERTTKVSDQGKGQASSPHKPADFIRRAVKPAEQSHRGNKPRVEQKSISSRGSTSNLKESRSQPQKDRTSRLHGRSFEARQFSQKPRNTGQERRRLRGGGDDDTTTQQQSDQTMQEAEAAKNPMEQAADYLRGLNQNDYNAFNAHKHGYHNDRGAEITEEHKRILQQPFD